MNKQDLIKLRHTLVAYQEYLGAHAYPVEAEAVGVRITYLEELVNRLPAEEAPQSTFAQAAPPSEEDKQVLTVRLGVMLAKNVPKNLGYMLMIFGGGDQKMQFVTTVNPETSVSLMRDFIRQYEPKV